MPDLTFITAPFKYVFSRKEKVKTSKEQGRWGVYATPYTLPEAILNFDLDNLSLGDFFQMRCVDTETRLLSKRGWLNWNEIEAGEEILTLNQASELSEWKPVKKVYKYDYTGKPLIYIKNRAWSAATTPNHRWLVYTCKGNFAWRETTDFPRGNHIPAAVPYGSFPRSEEHTS